MSWFKRRPRTKEPVKPTPHHSSPMGEKKMKEMKQSVNPDKKATQNSSR